MNLLKRSVFITVLASMGWSTVQADEEIASLPSIHVMAESEMRDEIGFVPFQEDRPVRQTLQHHLYKIENNIQNTNLNENPTVAINYQPITTPDMSQLSPELQQYILAVTSGLQSSDPMSGLYNLLQPLNINRNNIDAIREGTIKVNIDDILRLQQQIQDGLRGH